MFVKWHYKWKKFKLIFHIPKNMANFEMFFARTFHLKHKDPSDLHKHLILIISDKIL